MAIVKNIRLVTGVSVSYHTLTKLEVDLVSGNSTINVISHTDEEAAIAKLPSAWVWDLQVSSKSLYSLSSVELVEQSLVESTQEFANGLVVSGVTDSLEAHRKRKSEEIRAACEINIFSGFTCNALGESYLYPAKLTDQSNLVASVTDSLLVTEKEGWTTPFWCADSEGVWEFRNHTVDQIQTVGKAAKASILASMSKNEIIQRIVEVTEQEELPNIKWEMELGAYV